MQSRWLPKLLFAVGALLIGLFLVKSLRVADKTGWTDNQAQAIGQAKAEHKLVLMNFGGSDWCSECRQLDREVFSTPEFQKYAQDHLVLLEIDFPRNTYISPQVQAQNDQLAREYNVEAFPTIIVLDAEGKKVGELSYVEMKGGPKAFITALDKLKKA